MALPPRMIVKETVHYDSGKKDILVLDDDSVVFPEGENLIVADETVTAEIGRINNVIQSLQSRYQLAQDKKTELQRARQIIRAYINQ